LVIRQQPHKLTGHASASLTKNGLAHPISVCHRITYLLLREFRWVADEEASGRRIHGTRCNNAHRVRIGIVSRLVCGRGKTTTTTTTTTTRRRRQTKPRNKGVSRMLNAPEAHMRIRRDVWRMTDVLRVVCRRHYADIVVAAVVVPYVVVAAIVVVTHVVRRVVRHEHDAVVAVIVIAPTACSCRRSHSSSPFPLFVWVLSAWRRYFNTIMKRMRKLTCGNT
jgi:hypothetical protein